MPPEQPNVEALVVERGVIVGRETVRQWRRTFGPELSPPACGGAAHAPAPKRRLAEVVLKTNGQRYYLWRAVDHEGIVLDISVQRRRHQKAAEAFWWRLLAGLGDDQRVADSSLRLTVPRSEPPIR